MKKICKTLFAVAVVSSCDFSSIELDKVKGPTIDNIFAVNIGNIKYTVSELVNDLEDESLEVVEGSDFSMSFVYRDTSVFDDIDSFVEIDDITNTASYSPFDVDVPATGSDAVITLPTENFEFEFDPEEEEQLDSTFFKGGNLEFNLTSDFDVQIDYTFTLRDVKNDAGEPVVFSGTLPQGTSGSSQSRSLAGLRNVLRRSGPSNIFEVALDVTFQVPAGISIAASDEITLELRFAQPEFAAIFGDFGIDRVEVQRDSILISAFDEFGEDGLTLNDPSITMDFKNTFGIEFGVNLENVSAIDSDNSTLTLEGSVVDNPQFIDAPNITQLGSSVASSFSIVKTNSNIDELINSTPNKIVFEVEGTSNPAGSDNLSNYLLDTSYLEIVTSVEIPLDLQMDGFSKEFELSVSGEDVEDLDSLKVNVSVINEIPFNGFLDMSFRDADGNTLYTISQIALIESPQVGPDGRTTEALTTNSSVTLDNEGIEAFLNSTDVVATMSIFTLGHDSNQSVKVFSDYRLEIYLTAEGKVSINL